MKRMVAETSENSIVRWPSFYVALALAAVILIASTALWARSTQTASEETVNDLVEFYLEEIAERNANSITAALTQKAAQMEMALTVLDQDDLRDEASIRDFISMVQQINGLDMFALVDEEGMVYTTDATFSGISRFSFLSERMTETAIHMVKRYGTRTMVIIATPVSVEGPAGIRIVSCFTGLDIEDVVSEVQFQNAGNKTYCRLFTRDGENLLRIEGITRTGGTSLNSGRRLLISRRDMAWRASGRTGRSGSRAMRCMRRRAPGAAMCITNRCRGQA